MGFVFCLVCSCAVGCREFLFHHRCYFATYRVLIMITASRTTSVWVFRKVPKSQSLARTVRKMSTNVCRSAVVFINSNKNMLPDWAHEEQKEAAHVIVGQQVHGKIITKSIMLYCE